MQIGPLQPDAIGDDLAGAPDMRDTFASPAYERRERAQAQLDQLTARAKQRKQDTTYEIREEQIPWEQVYADGDSWVVDSLILGDDEEFTKIAPGRCYRTGTCR